MRFALALVAACCVFAPSGLSFAQEAQPKPASRSNDARRLQKVDLPKPPAPEGSNRLGDFEIQDRMSNHNQTETLSSSVLKKRDDTSNDMIGKISDGPKAAPAGPERRAPRQRKPPPSTD